MKTREARHRAILELVGERRIDSQESLLNLLSMEGLAVTQATLSRDLKALGVGKASAGAAGYYYTIPSHKAQMEAANLYLADLLRGWVSIKFTANLGVVKTLSGHADAVAIALDNLNLTGLLGTVAGDDTVFLALEDRGRGDSFLDDFARKVPELVDDLR